MCFQKLKNSNYYVNFKTKRAKERKAANCGTPSKGLTKIIESSCNKTLIATSTNKGTDYGRYNYCFAGKYATAPGTESNRVSVENVGPTNEAHSRLISHHHESNLVYYEQDKFFFKQECNTNCIIYDNREVRTHLPLTLATSSDHAPQSQDGLNLHSLDNGPYRQCYSNLMEVG